MLRAKPRPNRVGEPPLMPASTRSQRSAPAATAGEGRRRPTEDKDPSSTTTTTTGTASSLSSAVTMAKATNISNSSSSSSSKDPLSSARLSPTNLRRSKPSTKDVVMRFRKAGNVAQNKVKNTTGTAVNFVGVAGKGTVNFVGVAGKGTVKATRNVGKGVANNAAKIGARTAKGTFSATKLVAKNTVRVGKGTVGAVSYLPGNVMHLAGHTVNGVTSLLKLRNDGVSSTAAWKSRISSPLTKIELQLECHQLRRKDTFSECDAFCVIWEAPSGYGEETSIGMMGGHESATTFVTAGNASCTSLLTNTNNNTTGKENRKKKQPKGRIGRLPTHLEREIGRTEVIKGSRNPQFACAIPIDFHFHEEQTYVVRVYDRDLEYCSDLKEHDFLGGTVFTMGELMGVGKRTLKRPLNSSSNPNKRDKSVALIHGKEVTSARTVLEFRFSAQGLSDRDNKNIIDNQDTQYFKITKLNRDDQTWEPVYKSEVAMDNSNPTWEKATIPLPVICNDNTQSPIRINFWNWVRGAASQRLGYVETTVQKIVHGAQRGIPVLDVVREQKRKFGGSKLQKSGHLKIIKAELKPIPTMLEYIYGGCELDLMIAVDCSSHNGPSNHESGLHYRPGNWLVNDYQAAIHKIGAITEPYSKDQQFTIWGFGATVSGESVPLFPMGNGDGVVKGAKGLLDAYDTTFEENPLFVEPDDVANIAPLIEKAMYQAIQKMETQQCYSVLCILTACKIADNLRRTIDTICTAAEDAPLSIVIIGVGEDNKEDLEAMKALLVDGSKLLDSNGVPVSRNIVHFAAFRDFGNHVGNTIGEGLKELPEQLLEHFSSNGIKPHAPPVETDTGGLLSLVDEVLMARDESENSAVSSGSTSLQKTKKTSS